MKVLIQNVSPHFYSKSFKKNYDWFDQFRHWPADFLIVADDYKLKNNEIIIEVDSNTTQTDLDSAFIKKQLKAANIISIHTPRGKIVNESYGIRRNRLYVNKEAEFEEYTRGMWSSFNQGNHEDVANQIRKEGERQSLGNDFIERTIWKQLRQQLDKIVGLEGTYALSNDELKVIFKQYMEWEKKTLSTLYQKVAHI